MTSLHSTMVLLIPSLRNPIRQNIRFLHSTMFLLILIMHHETNAAHHFTFHNVSINTWRQHKSSCILWLTLHSTMFLLILKCQQSATQSLQTLHSTMFLLIRIPEEMGCRLQFHFTFHNVSINTQIRFLLHRLHLSLHSTMFLLILLPLHFVF